MSRHSLTIALLICMTTAAVAAECAPPNVPSETDAKRQVVQLDDEWLQAELRHDAVTLDRILDDKFVATFGGKKTYDRATFIKAITTGPADPTETQSLDRELVIIEGDTAVVVETDTLHKIKNGAPYSAFYRFTVTYVYRGGRWLALAEQGAAADQVPNS